MPAISERKALILEFDHVIRELAIQTDDANSEIDEVLDLKCWRYSTPRIILSLHLTRSFRTSSRYKVQQQQ